MRWSRPRFMGLLARVRKSWELSLALILLGAVLMPPSTARAAATPPEFMTYQGFLVDANGNPLAPTTPQNYPVVFRIYTAASAGTLVWSEQQIVTVDRGSFSVLLGEGTPLGGEPRPLLSSVFAGATASDRYVSAWLTIGASTTEILPRSRLVPSPYSFLATSANNLVQPNGTPVVSYAGGQVSISGNLSSSGTITGNGAGLTGLTAGQIPNLDASKITAGTLQEARVPNLDASKIATGTLTEARIPSSLSGTRIFSGNIGIGTTTPTARLSVNGGVSANGNVSVNGGVSVSASNTLEFGSGIAGKEVNAGKIGYQTFTPGALDIVGAGTNGTSRRVKIFAEGGLEVNGGVKIFGEAPFHFQTLGFSGTTGYDTGWSTSTYTASVVGFRALNGDMQESGTVNIIQVYMYRNSTTGTWWVYGDFASHNVNERWEIQVMRVVNGMVSANSTFF